MRKIGLRFNDPGSSRRHLTTLVALCAWLACMSCSDDAASPESGAESGAGDDGHDAGIPGDEPPAFLIGTRVWNDTTTTSYAQPTPFAQDPQ
jgi:hypothetical protein